MLKYGEEEGTAKWFARQEKWQKTLNDKPEEIERINQEKVWKSGNSSKISMELFEAIAIAIPGCKYGNKTDGHSGEIMVPFIDRITGKQRYMMLDFTFGNKVIEFYGDYWHANPTKYKNDNIIFKRRNGYITAKQLRENDAIRNAILVEKGFQVMCVWEKDFRKNKQGIINDCINFLQNATASDKLVPLKKDSTSWESA